MKNIFTLPLLSPQNDAAPEIPLYSIYIEVVMIPSAAAMQRVREKD